MLAREEVSVPETNFQQDIRIHTDNISEERLGGENKPSIDAPTRTLSPISSNAMNTLSPPHSHDHHKPTPNGTIRSVPNDSNYIPSPEDSRRQQAKSEPMPHSTLKQSSAAPAIHTSLPPLTRQNSIPLPQNGIVRTISAEFGPSRTFNTSPNPEDTTSPNGGSGGNQWSSAVGRANLGKSGRVIERLMGENDMLKREVNLERLRAEESKQAVKMAEGRMEALAGEYEGRLHDAAINKTLLKRRERQLTDLKSQVEAEKQKADAAVESERGWREAMERAEEDAKRKVEEAQVYAALLEGRNKALTSHWKEQGQEVERTVGRLGQKIGTLVEERKSDDRRMNMLQNLCEQQAEQLGKLREEKDGIGRMFDRYKEEQEVLLRDIKEKALQQERANEAILEESRKVLGELKWALSVKKNVKGAQ